MFQSTTQKEPLVAPYLNFVIKMYFNLMFMDIWKKNAVVQLFSLNRGQPVLNVIVLYILHLDLLHKQN